MLSRHLQFNVFFLTTVFTLFFSSILNALTLNNVAICGDEQYQSLNCNNTLLNNDRITINDISKIYVVTSINNNTNTDRILQIRYIFNPKKTKNFTIQDTVYKNKSLKPLPKNKRKNILEGSVFDIQLLIKSSPSYRTFAYKTLDRNMHIGKWRIEISDESENIMFSFNLEVLD